MYKIISGGKIMALCDAPRYVKVKPSSGAYIQCTREEAEGISINGTLYNMPGGTAIADAPEAEALFVDGGSVLFDGYVDKAKYLTDMAYLEDALCEIDAANGMEE